MSAVKKTKRSIVRLNQNGVPDQRRAKREEHVARALKALTKPRTVDELIDLIGVSKRGVYWVLDDLRERGLAVARTGSRDAGRYVLIVPGA